MKGLVGSVSADASLHSLSFNEYLTLVSQQRRNGPTESLLLEAFMYEYFQRRQFNEFYIEFTGNSIILNADSYQKLCLSKY